VLKNEDEEIRNSFKELRYRVELCAEKSGELTEQFYTGVPKKKDESIAPLFIGGF
jgi:hypothetical protein